MQEEFWRLKYGLDGVPAKIMQEVLSSNRGQKTVQEELSGFKFRLDGVLQKMLFSNREQKTKNSAFL